MQSAISAIIDIIHLLIKNSLIMKLKITFILLLSLFANQAALATKGAMGTLTEITVDKTPFFKAIIEDKNKIMLITRPHSWGGTFNMSAIENFFSPNITSDCCDNKVVNYVKMQKIQKEVIGIDKKILDKYFAKYPTISISFISHKLKDQGFFRKKLELKIRNLFWKYTYLTKSTKLTAEDIALLEKYAEKTPNLTDDEIKNSIRFLSDMMYKHFEMPIIIIFNKYDDFLKAHTSELLRANKPIEEDEVIKMGYDLYGGMIYNNLKNNPHLYKSLIMGTTKVGGMKIWDKLPHSEDSIFKPKWGDYFGFTKTELLSLMQDYKVKNVNEKMLEKIKRYYGGHKLGKQDIYNPAAIMYMLETYRAHREIRFDYLRYIPIVGDFTSPARKGTFTNLIEGKSIDINVDPNISYMQAGSSSENFYALMLMEGFLTATQITPLDNGKYKCRVKIPNEEIRDRFRRLISNKQPIL